jgi:hypothetical protein
MFFQTDFGQVVNIKLPSFALVNCYGDETDDNIIIVFDNDVQYQRHHPLFTIPWEGDLFLPRSPKLPVFKKFGTRLKYPTILPLFTLKIMNMKQKLITNEQILNAWYESVHSAREQSQLDVLNQVDETQLDVLKRVASSLEQMSLDVEFYPGLLKYEEGKTDFELNKK